MGQQFTMDNQVAPSEEVSEKPAANGADTPIVDWIDTMKEAPDATLDGTRGPGSETLGESSPVVSDDVLQGEIDSALTLTVADLAGSQPEVKIAAGTTLGDAEVDDSTIDPADLPDGAPEIAPENKDEVKDDNGGADADGDADADADADSDAAASSEKKEIVWTGDVPAGSEQELNNGKQYIDGATGFTNGIRYTDGPRAGQEYQFSRDAAGNVAELAIRVNGASADEAKEIKLKKSDDGSWILEPKEAAGNIPEFQNLKFNESEDGSAVLEGKITVTADGTIKYDRGDGLNEVVRPSGVRDVIDMNDYSRVREVNGETEKQYWDGYEWRAGEVDPENPNSIVFNPPAEGKPARMVRDGENDTFRVEFSNGLTYDADWRNQKINRSGGELPAASLYPTSHLNSSGNPVWMAGEESQDADGNIRIQFKPGNADERARMQSGELPVETLLERDSDRVRVKYGNGTEISTSREGEVSKVEHVNGQMVQLTRDITGRVIKIEGLGGRTYERQGSVGEGAAQTTRWSVSENGQEVGVFDGDAKVDPNGTVDLANLNGDRINLDHSGRIVVADDHKIIGAIDAQGQSWELVDSEAGSDKPRWRVTADGNETFFNGEIKLLDNGGIAVETPEGKTESVNRDGSEWTPPGDGALPFPPRQPGSEMAGSAFMRDVLGVDPSGNLYDLGVVGVEREQAILAQIEAGNIPDFLREPKKVVLQDDKGNTAEVSVMPDYLAIGTNDDWVRVPITPILAQTIADRYGMELPTKKVAEAVYQQADVKLVYDGLVNTRTDERSMTGNGFYIKSNNAIEARLGDTPDGALVAGHKKDLIYSQFAERNQDRLDYYGFYKPDGTVIQDSGGGPHDNVYVDYSHGVRFVAETVIVNGKPMKYEDILGDPDLAKLLDFNGTMDVNNMYRNPANPNYNALLNLVS